MVTVASSPSQPALACEGGAVVAATSEGGGGRCPVWGGHRRQVTAVSAGCSLWSGGQQTEGPAHPAAAIVWHCRGGGGGGGDVWDCV